MSDDLLKLAARCESATGPDRELDALIQASAVLTGLGQFKTAQAWADAAIAQRWNVPRYTASLDAATTLAGCGPRRVEFGTYGNGQAWAYVHIEEPEALGESEKAASEVLAVCAAALRAKAVQ